MFKFENKVLDIEPEIDSGDISLYCPTIIHGVEAIDGGKLNTYDWNSGIGRWWMGLFTNDSNLKEVTEKRVQSLETYHSEK